MTYARVASDPRGWAGEVHARHAGDRRRGAPPRRGSRLGHGLPAGVRRARRAGCCCRGTPFRSDATPIPGVRYDADGLAMPDVSYTYAEAVRRRGLPPGDVRHLRRHALVAQRRGRDRVLLRDRAERARGEPPLPHRDLDRAARRAAADPARGRRASCARCAPTGHRDAGGLAVAADAEHARRDREAAARGDRARAGGRAAHRGAAPREARRLPRTRASRGSSR